MKWDDPLNYWRFQLRMATAYTKDRAFHAGLNNDTVMIRFWSIETRILEREIDEIDVLMSKQQ